VRNRSFDELKRLVRRRSQNSNGPAGPCGHKTHRPVAQVELSEFAGGKASDLEPASAATAAKAVGALVITEHPMLIYTVPRPLRILL
jgi:hypothetical protein